MSFFSELRRRNVFRVAIAYSVVAWLVAQVAELALDSFGSPDWVMKTLLLFLVLGLPIAIIFAWAFEMTPEGLKREKDVDRSQSITQQTGRKLNYSIIGVLAAALVFSLATRNWSSQAPDEASTSQAGSGDKSIAVLPFVNMSDDKDNEYFSDGISEELLNVLVKVEGLRVASRTSSFSFKGKDTPIPDIAEALKVEHVLEGSVRKAGDTVRITAQLIDVQTDSHLWSETYDRKLEDIFVIQDEISAHIVESLKVALGTQAEVVKTHSKPTENLTAYEDYLRGRHFWQRRGADNIRKAIELFEKATREDPEFARAWSSLAAAHLTMPTYSRDPEENHYPKALANAQRALELDPSIAEAHAVIGDLKRIENQWAEAEPYYLRAIELEPRNSTSHLWHAELLSCVGHGERALEAGRIAYELDPFHAGTNSMMSYISAMNGDTEGAVRYSQSALDLGHPAAFFQLMDFYIIAQKYDDLDRLLDSAGDDLDPTMLDELRLYIEARKSPDEVDAFFEAVADVQEYSLFARGMDQVHFGMVEEGIANVLQDPPSSNDWMLIWLPDMYPLREHPRFGELLRLSGIKAYWDNYGWPSQCSQDGETITCN